MGVVREEESLDGVKKKSKKRKNESSALGGEDVTMQLGDEACKKKRKSKASDVINASEAVTDVDSNLDRDNSSKKKKEKGKSYIDAKDRENNKKSEKKKSKMGDEVGSSHVLEVSDEKVQDTRNSEQQPRKKEKTHVKEIEKFDGKTMKDKEENSAIRSDVDLISDFELAKEGGEQPREEPVKKKNKKKTASKLETKEAHCIDAGFAVNQNDNEPVKEKKKKKKKHEDDSGKETSSNSHVDLMSCGDDTGADGHVCNEVIKGVESVEDRKRKKKKRKVKSIESNGEGDASASASETNNRNEAMDPSEKTTPNKKSKKVTFSSEVEVFPSLDDSSKGKKKTDNVGNGKKKVEDEGLVRGKRFSEEEDELVREAVFKYIEDHQLGEDGLEMVLKCKSHPEIKDCWKEIGEALPWRPYQSVYYRGHILFERSETRKWTEEELELVKEFYKQHGAAWRKLGDGIGKHRFHVKDAWRRIKLANRKRGNWSQEEYENLFKLVNVDLSMKAYQEKKSKHGMLRDNISWEAISEKLTTRTNALCCQKWYNQLTSPMVAEGLWADVDDYRLLIALVDLDASCEEDVKWDELLEHRSGDLCRKRWHQMVRHIGEHGNKSFCEQVEILSQRYCPDLLEPREIYDSKPVVD